MRIAIARRGLSVVGLGVMLVAGDGCSSRSAGTDAPDPVAADAPNAAEEGRQEATSPQEVPVGSGGADAAPDGGADAAVAVVPRSYVVATRTIQSSSVERSFILATPTPPPSSPLPLGMRAAVPLEEASKGEAVFVYPSAPGGIFRYWTVAGRKTEAQFVRDVVSLLVGELGIDTRRVFLSGFSGGATMANSLACMLGPSFVRGVGIHSGTLYPADDYAGGEGGVSDCPLPSALIVWGTADTTSGTTYPEGVRTRDRYHDRLSCAATTTPAPVAPCVAYDGCTAPLTWCSIEGHGHALWSGAAAAMWTHFAGLR
jgi:polyhydroxybutyrate depolymerase